MYVRLVSALVITLSATSFASWAFAASLSETATLTTPLPEAPPMPEGFGGEAAAKKAAEEGKIELVNLSPDLPDNIRADLDLVFATRGEKQLLLDLYRPAEVDGPIPLIVIVHGGGWTRGDRHQLAFYAVHFAQRGYAAAAISYRLSQEAAFPAQMQDVLAAIRWLKVNAREYGLDPSAVALSGHSAGAHLALLAAYAPDAPLFQESGGEPDVDLTVRCVIDVYGPTDLTLPELRSGQGIQRLMGAPYEDDPTRYELASPLLQVNKDVPPTLIIHGDADNLVHVSHSDRLAASLKENGVPFMYDRFPGWGHEMDRAEAVNARVRFYMEQFLSRYLPLGK